MASLMPNGKQQYTDANGAPLVGGKVHTYEAGTTTPKATYSDAGGTTPNTNPIILDARGEALIYWDGSYKVVVKDADDNTLYTVDPYTPVDAEFSGEDGAGLIGFLQDCTGAVARTVQDKFYDHISVTDFGSTSDPTILTALEAVRTNGGGKLICKRETISTEDGVKIVGEYTHGVTLDGQRATITPTVTGISGLKVCNEVGSIASQYQNKTCIRDINVTHTGTTGGTIGVKVEAASEIVMDNLRIRNAQTGLWLEGGLSSDFYNLTVRNCYLGVKASVFDDGVGGLNSFSPNANSFYGMRVFYNDLAVNYDNNPSGAVNWVGCNFEANNQSGTAADGVKVLALTNAGHHNFIGCHFESNKGQYGIHYTGFDNSKSLLLAGDEIIHECDTVVHMAKGRLTAIASRITNSLATNDIYLATGARATLIDTEANVSGDTSYLACLRDGRLKFGGQPIIGDPLISGDSASIVAASNIASNFRNDTTQHRWQNTAGTRIGYMQWGSAADTVMHCDHAFGWRFDVNNTNRFYIGRSGGASVEPATDNNVTGGSASLRFSVIYAGTGAINTSDERAKQQVGDITDAVLDAWSSVQYSQYKFNDAVAEKGDAARWHFGVVAQRVKEVFEAAGLNPFTYGLLCYDEWDDQTEPILDENGDPTGTERIIVPAGNRYGIRYEEALVLEAALQRRTTQRLQQRLDQLQALIEGQS
jgi:hypothetical protein